MCVECVCVSVECMSLCVECVCEVCGVCVCECLRISCGVSFCSGYSLWVCVLKTVSTWLGLCVVR